MQFEVPSAIPSQWQILFISMTFSSYFICQLISVVVMFMFPTDEQIRWTKVSEKLLYCINHESLFFFNRTNLTKKNHIHTVSLLVHNAMSYCAICNILHAIFKILWYSLINYVIFVHEFMLFIYRYLSGLLLWHSSNRYDFSGPVK